MSINQSSPYRSCNHCNPPLKSKSFLEKNWKKVLGAQLGVVLMAAIATNRDAVRSALQTWSDHNGKIKILGAELENATADKKKVESDNTSLKNQLDAAYGTITDLKLKIQDLNGGIDSARRPNEAQMDYIKRLEGYVTNLKAKNPVIDKDRKMCVASVMSAKLDSGAFFEHYSAEKLFQKCGGIDLTTTDCLMSIDHGAYMAEYDPDGLTKISACDVDAIEKMTAKK